MRCLEIDEQHSNLVAGVDIAHRQEHSVAVVTRENDCVEIHHPDEARSAPFVRAGGITTMIDGGEKEHIAAFDKCFLIVRKLRLDDHFLHSISQPSCIKSLLQDAMLCAVDLAHGPLPKT